MMQATGSGGRITAIRDASVWNRCHISAAPFGSQLFSIPMPCRFALLFAKNIMNKYRILDYDGFSPAVLIFLLNLGEEGEKRDKIQNRVVETLPLLILWHKNTETHPQIIRQTIYLDHLKREIEQNLLYLKNLDFPAYDQLSRLYRSKDARQSLQNCETILEQRKAAYHALPGTGTAWKAGGEDGAPREMETIQPWAVSNSFRTILEHVLSSSHTAGGRELFDSTVREPAVFRDGRIRQTVRGVPGNKNLQKGRPGYNPSSFDTSGNVLPQQSVDFHPNAKTNDKTGGSAGYFPGTAVSEPQKDYGGRSPFLSVQGEERVLEYLKNIDDAGFSEICNNIRKYSNIHEFAELRDFAVRFSKEKSIRTFPELIQAYGLLSGSVTPLLAERGFSKSRFLKTLKKGSLAEKIFLCDAVRFAGTSTGLRKDTGLYKKMDHLNRLLSETETRRFDFGKIDSADSPTLKQILDGTDQSDWNKLEKQVIRYREVVSRQLKYLSVLHSISDGSTGRDNLVTLLREAKNERIFHIIRASLAARSADQAGEGLKSEAYAPPIPLQAGKKLSESLLQNGDGSSQNSGMNENAVVKAAGKNDSLLDIIHSFEWMFQYAPDQTGNQFYQSYHTAISVRNALRASATGSAAVVTGFTGNTVFRYNPYIFSNALFPQNDIKMDTGGLPLKESGSCEKFTPVFRLYSSFLRDLMKFNASDLWTLLPGKKYGGNRISPVRIERYHLAYGTVLPGSWNESGQQNHTAGKHPQAWRQPFSAEPTAYPGRMGGELPLQSVQNNLYHHSIYLMPAANRDGTIGRVPVDGFGGGAPVTALSDSRLSNTATNLNWYRGNREIPAIFSNARNSFKQAKQDEKGWSETAASKMKLPVQQLISGLRKFAIASYNMPAGSWAEGSVFEKINLIAEAAVFAGTETTAVQDNGMDRMFPSAIRHRAEKMPDKEKQGLGQIQIRFAAEQYPALVMQTLKFVPQAAVKIISLRGLQTQNKRIADGGMFDVSSLIHHKAAELSGPEKRDGNGSPIRSLTKNGPASVLNLWKSVTESIGAGILPKAVPNIRVPHGGLIALSAAIHGRTAKLPGGEMRSSEGKQTGFAGNQPAPVLNLLKTISETAEQKSNDGTRNKKVPNSPIRSGRLADPAKTGHTAAKAPYKEEQSTAGGAIGLFAEHNPALVLNLWKSVSDTAEKISRNGAERIENKQIPNGRLTDVSGGIHHKTAESQRNAGGAIGPAAVKSSVLVLEKLKSNGGKTGAGSQGTEIRINRMVSSKLIQLSALAGQKAAQTPDREKQGAAEDSKRFRADPFPVLVLEKFKSVRDITTFAPNGAGVSGGPLPDGGAMNGPNSRDSAGAVRDDAPIIFHHDGGRQEKEPEGAAAQAVSRVELIKKFGNLIDDPNIPPAELIGKYSDSKKRGAGNSEDTHRAARKTAKEEQAFREETRAISELSQRLSEQKSKINGLEQTIALLHDEMSQGNNTKKIKSMLMKELRAEMRLEKMRYGL